MPHMMPLDFETVPEDIQQRFTHYKETRGFTPNSIQTMARRPDIVRAFMQLNQAVLYEGTVSEELKMLVSLKTRHVLGVQIVGEGATELIHIGQAVMDLKGTVDYFVQNTFNYPTLAEAYKIAGLDAFNRMPIPEEFKVKKKPAEPAKKEAKKA